MVQMSFTAVECSKPNDDGYYELEIRPEVIGITNRLLDHIGISSSELIKQSIFYYRPEIFLESSIDHFQNWVFLDEQQQGWLKEASAYAKIPLEDIFHYLFKLDLKLKEKRDKQFIRY